MKLEGFAGYDDVRLKTAIKVPKAAVGRIIGKGGKTVKEIQHSTGVIIKLPNNAADEADEDDDGVFVAVYGNFLTTQVLRGTTINPFTADPVKALHFAILV